MKKALFVVAAVALLTVSVQAGEIKIHQWPCSSTPLDLTTIPVLMDVGYYVGVVDQAKVKIKMAQESIHIYSGCTNMVVKSNVAIALSVSIVSTSPIAPNDKLSTWIDGSANLPMGTNTVKVCAKLTDADLSAVPGGTSDVQVATVTVKVVPM
jgi:hypothetical protein